MEMKRGVSFSSVLMVCLVLGVIMNKQSIVEGGPILDAGGCYGGCMVRCVITSGDVGSCAYSCLLDCLLTKSAVALKDTNSFCKLGCATALCSKISTKDNIAEKKVGRCVDSCSATCTKKN